MKYKLFEQSFPLKSDLKAQCCSKIYKFNLTDPLINCSATTLDAMNIFI